MERLKHLLAHLIPGLIAFAIAVPVWYSTLAGNGTPESVLGIKIVALSTALAALWKQLETTGLLPTWLDSNPHNDDNETPEVIDHQGGYEIYGTVDLSICQATDCTKCETDTKSENPPPVAD